MGVIHTRRNLMFLLIIIGLSALGSCSSSVDSEQRGEFLKRKTRVLLIGASIGEAWNLKELPLRLTDDKHVFESVAAWQYDKSEALEEVLMRPKRKFRFTKTYVKGFFQPPPQLPNIVILKECASYFPGDQHVYQEFIKKWVARIKQAQIQVILATVVPVTRERASKRAGQTEAIWQFNDWIRAYAKTEGLILLDLESSLRQSPEHRYLREDFTSGDGQHLNIKAYHILDRLLEEILEGNRNL